MKRRKGFTLIELLIVVAIIAILAAIAVPNFLEAQTRSKVSRVKTDLRTIATGLESYRLDSNAYPLVRANLVRNAEQHNRGGIHGVWDLTTPIAYLSTVDYVDPFQRTGGRNEFGHVAGNPDPWGTAYSLSYVNIRLYREQNDLQALARPDYVLLSLGPDQIRGPNPYGTAQWAVGNYARDPLGTNYYVAATYDATNGTRSAGDIFRWQ